MYFDKDTENYVNEQLMKINSTSARVGKQWRIIGILKII